MIMLSRVVKVALIILVCLFKTEKGSAVENPYGKHVEVIQRLAEDNPARSHGPRRFCHKEGKHFL